MNARAETSIAPRWERVLSAPNAIADELAFTGISVGPRTGPDRRTHGEKEDFVFRRLLIACRDAGRLEFPLSVRAEAEANGEPDFVLGFSGGATLGVEVTEAGDEDYQAWLTKTERVMSADEAVLLPGDGIVDGVEIQNVARQIRDAIEKRVRAYDNGKYRGPDHCDLVVYDNTAWGGFLDRRDVLRHLARPNDLVGRFRQIHLVFGNTVVLDVFGDQNQIVDVSKAYEIDYARWIADQAERLQSKKTDGLDWRNLAEELGSLGRAERNALRSHLENLLMHLLKWQFQSERRTASWEMSIRNARAEIYELLREQPSLKAGLADDVQMRYRTARRIAAAETGLPLARFPTACPYALSLVFDPEFYPEPGSTGSGEEAG